MFKKLIAKIAAKAVLGKTSATVSAVAVPLVAIGVAMQSSPAVHDLVLKLVPDNLEGIVVAALGLVVAIARYRTLGK